MVPVKALKYDSLITVLLLPMINALQTEIGQDITYAATLLQAGKLVAIPTETVYGLAGNALNESAVAAIFEAKNRPTFNPLIIHVASVKAIEAYAVLSAEARLLADAFMPGPFTLLLPKKAIVPDLVTAGSEKVAVRIPNHPITQQLLQQLDFPLAAPSANPFGYVSPTTAQHVWEGLQGKIDYILDGGNSAVGLESTIVEVLDDEIILHRSGGISIEAIAAITKKKIIVAAAHEQPATPGQLKSHYATHTPLFRGDVEKLLVQYNDKKKAVISFCNDYDTDENTSVYKLSSNKDLAAAAAKLFSVMRQIDQQNFDVILTEYFPNEGIGRAINDRLNRARFEMKDDVK
jgi:L-threonylcarbamoyladenylate synthase